MTNRRSGFAAEARYMYSNWLDRYAGSRYYASMGIFDCIFVDKNFNTRFVQVKYSKIGRPRISPKEIIDIQIWIDQNSLKGVRHIWVGYVLWSSRRKPEEYRLNV
jgi:hypothetical protein